MNSDGYKFEKSICGEYVVFHSYDHDYNSPMSYDDEYLYISDFNVFRFDEMNDFDEYLDKEDTKKLHKFSSKIFGKNYTTELIKKLNADKEKLNKNKEKYQNTILKPDIKQIDMEISDIDEQIKEIEKMW